MVYYRVCPLGRTPAKEAKPMPTPITASTLSALLSAALAQKPTRPLVLALETVADSRVVSYDVPF